MKDWKKKLLWPLVAVAVSLAASQAAFAGGDDDDDDDNYVKPPTNDVPDAGSSALLVAGALLGVEALRRKMKRS